MPIHEPSRGEERKIYSAVYQRNSYSTFKLDKKLTPTLKEPPNLYHFSNCVKTILLPADTLTKKAFLTSRPRHIDVMYVAQM